VAHVRNRHPPPSNRTRTYLQENLNRRVLACSVPRLHQEKDAPTGLGCSDGICPALSSHRQQVRRGGRLRPPLHLVATEKCQPACPQPPHMRPPKPLQQHPDPHHTDAVVCVPCRSVSAMQLSRAASISHRPTSRVQVALPAQRPAPRRAPSRPCYSRQSRGWSQRSPPVVATRPLTGKVPLSQSRRFLGRSPTTSKTSRACWTASE